MHVRIWVPRTLALSCALRRRIQFDVRCDRRYRCCPAVVWRGIVDVLGRIEGAAMPVRLNGVRMDHVCIGVMQVMNRVVPPFHIHREIRDVADVKHGNGCRVAVSMALQLFLKSSQSIVYNGPRSRGLNGRIRLKAQPAVSGSAGLHAHGQQQ